jgi:hypothetical protein
LENGDEIRSRQRRRFAKTDIKFIEYFPFGKFGFEDSPVPGSILPDRTKPSNRKKSGQKKETIK